MDPLANAKIVEFPLRGEWFAPNTPARKVPSHGTDMLGQRYAVDFVMAHWEGRGKMLFRGSPWRYYVFGMPLARWYGWGQNVYAPCDGVIVEARDGLAERRTVHLATDLSLVLKHALFFRSEKHDIHYLAGNYIIMQCDNAYAFLAHFQKDSICVTEGQSVRTGEPVGRVGHSGNSTAPHLHFQLMDSPDLFAAQGIPCVFDRYERFRHGEWEEVRQAVPAAEDRIRRLD